MVAISSRRRQHGLGSVELAAGAFALCIMVILSVDLGVLMLGNQVLDRAARDAARAAATQNNQTNAVNAAKAALAMHHTDGTFVSQPALTSTSPPDFVYQDYGGVPFGQPLPGGGTAGNASVTVTTKVNVLLPASLGVLGVQLQQGSLLNGKMTFIRQYTFPIVKQGLSPNYS